MKTSLKTGFAQVFSCCPKKAELPKIWEGLEPPSPPRPVRLWWQQTLEMPETILLPQEGLPSETDENLLV